MHHESEPYASEIEPLRTEEKAIKNSAIEAIIFRGKKLIARGEFTPENTMFHAEVVQDPGEPGHGMLLLFLKNDSGEETNFGLNETRKILIGDYEDYRLSDLDIELLKQLKTHAK